LVLKERLIRNITSFDTKSKSRLTVGLALLTFIYVMASL